MPDKVVGTPRWYQNSIVVIICLILFFPLGLFLMWTQSPWQKSVKIGITGFIVLVFIVSSSHHASEVKTPEAALNTASLPPSPTVLPSPTEKATPVVSADPLFDSFSSQARANEPNGGFPNVMVIPANEVNETDMTTLGSRFNEASKNSQRVFVSFYSDQKAADLREQVTADAATKAELAFYDKHFVGQYTKNASTGFNQFVMYLDGLNGKSKTIKY